MNKNTALVVVSSVVLSCGAIAVLYLTKKYKKSNTAIEEMPMSGKIAYVPNTDIGGVMQINDTVSDQDSQCIDTVYFDDDISDDEVSQDIRNRREIHQFIVYLMKNGLKEDEVLSICETIALIEEKLPNEFHDVRRKMIDIMDSGDEFDLQKSLQFDNENYNLLYSSIDPCQLFITHGFEILAMGADCQDDMRNLAEALTDLREENKNEAAEVMYAIFHIFCKTNIENFTPDTYTDKFKKYVDKYVKKDDE